jgi:2-oxoglutarate ferredoxin oxidoreductase subunit beta
LPADQYGKLSDEAKKAHFAIGKLVERNDPDFNSRYEDIRTRAARG